jgi:SNF2 family DNA or RNA helicase
MITTFEMLLADATELSEIDWALVVVDEAHRLKNSSSKVSLCLKNYDYRAAVYLTGTPIQNNLVELFALCNGLDPDRFADQDEFMARFGNMRETKQVDELHAELRPFLLRRMKEEVEKNIPAREETLVEVELTVLQKRYYRAIYEQNREFLAANAKAKGAQVSLMNVAVQLRKCCNHPFLLEGVEDTSLGYRESMEQLVQASGKLVLLDKLLPKLKAGGHRVLVFSQMVRMLNVLEDYLR